jgi:hypothetical protein
VVADFDKDGGDGGQGLFSGSLFTFAHARAIAFG